MISKFIRYFGGGFLVLAVVAAAYGAVFAGSAQPEYSMEVLAEGATDEDVAKAEQALNRFLESCPTIEKETDNRIVNGPEIDLRESMPYRKEAHGWPMEVSFRFEVANDSKVAGGHTLEYFIWGDRWVTQKPQGAEFCGHQGTAAADTVVSL